MKLAKKVFDLSKALLRPSGKDITNVTDRKLINIVPFFNVHIMKILNVLY